MRETRPSALPMYIHHHVQRAHLLVWVEDHGEQVLLRLWVESHALSREETKEELSGDTLQTPVAAELTKTRFNLSGAHIASSSSS